MFRTTFVRSVTVLGLVAMAACGPDGESPVAPDAVLDIVPAPGEFVVLRVCKTSRNSFLGIEDDGTLGRSFGFNLTATDGNLLPGFVLEARPWTDVNDWYDDLGCALVWGGPDRSFDDVTQITITEELPDGSVLDQVIVRYWDDAYPDEGVISYPTADNPSITLVPRAGATLFFKNRTDFVPPPPPPPPTGIQGCTPGYWRQPHHFDSWVGFDPNDVFSDVFGVGPDEQLRKSIRAKKGGENALRRHAVAALLSASSPDVDYPLTVDEVIEAVQAAYASGDFESTKDVLDEFNNLGCPLN